VLTETIPLHPSITSAEKMGQIACVVVRCAATWQLHKCETDARTQGKVVSLSSFNFHFGPRKAGQGELAAARSRSWCPKSSQASPGRNDADGKVYHTLAHHSLDPTPLPHTQHCVPSPTALSPAVTCAPRAPHTQVGLKAGPALSNAKPSQWLDNKPDVRPRCAHPA